MFADITASVLRTTMKKLNDNKAPQNDRFVVLSTKDQIAESARRHRSGETGLVLVAVEAGRLGDRIKWEPSRDGALFPHLYGPLFPDEAASVVALPLGPDGEHAFPPLS